MKTLIALASLALPTIAELPKEKPAPPAKSEAAMPDGSSFEKAIQVKSVAAEYEWLRANFPGHKVRMQALKMHKGKPYDMLAITTKDGKERDVYFDISSFFGKGFK